MLTRPSLTQVTLPDSISSINEEAFFGCSNLAQINLPDRLTSIEGRAFYGCAGLTQITLPDSLASIGDWAFLGCTGLNAFEVDPLNPVYSSPDGVLVDTKQATLLQCPAKKAGDYALPITVNAIGSDAFRDCTDLTSVTIPASVTIIESETFSGCIGLRAIEVDPSNPAYSSRDGVLFDKNQSSLLQCPAKKAGDYTLPSSVKRIEVSAFSGCSNLVRVTVADGVTYIGYSAFSGCSRLTEVTLGQAVERLNDGLFSECRSLKSLTIPDSVRDVAAMVTGHETPVFSNCLELRQVHLGRGLAGVRWGWSAFFRTCPNLASISVAEDHPVYRSIDGVLFSRDGTELVCVPRGRTGLYVVPAGVKSIRDGAIIFSEKLAFIGFTGDAPRLGLDGLSFFVESGSPKVLYLPGTTGWKATFGDVPTALWLPSIGRPAFAADQPAGALGFPIEWAPQRQVTVDACTNLLNPDWQPVGTLTLDANGSAPFSDPDAALAPARFYRLRTP